MQLRFVIICSDNLCLFVRALIWFTFNVITDKLQFKSARYIFFLQPPPTPQSPASFLFSFGLIEFVIPFPLFINLLVIYLMYYSFSDYRRSLFLTWSSMRELSPTERDLSDHFLNYLEDVT